MKHTLTIFIALAIGLPAFSQTTMKEAKKDVKRSGTIKEARKESKKWEKQGYTNLPGNLPLANQFEKSMLMQVMITDEGEQRFLSATGSAISGSEGVAQANAIDNTRLILAGQIQAEVSALVTNNKGNTGFTADEVQTVDEFLSSSKTLIQNKIGNIKSVIEMVRRVGDKFEYRLTVMYDTQNAKRIAKDIMVEKLDKKLTANEAELNKLLGL